MISKVIFAALFIAVSIFGANAKAVHGLRQNRDYVVYPGVVSNGPFAFGGVIASGGWGDNSRGGDGNQIGAFIGNGNNGGDASAGHGGYSSSSYYSSNYYPYYYWY